jgi:glycosyltransferase involved in cell wall biosynthesis
VLDVRDIPLETAEELGLIRHAWMLRMARSFEAAIFRRADHIVCVSDEMAKFVCARGISPEKVSTNYIGYDNFEKPPVVTHELRNQLVEGLDPMTAFVVFYAGTLATLVDIPTVLQAAENVKGDRRIGFVIVGDGERREAYLEQAKEKELNVHFPGRVAKERVHELCAASDACVYPLQGGPATAAMLGNKVFDYLGAGKPIIYTGPDGAVARLIDHLGAGFVLPERDANGLARTVYGLSKDPEKFSGMGAKGRNAVIETMTAAHSARDLSEKLFKMIRGAEGVYARRKSRQGK